MTNNFYLTVYLTEGFLTGYLRLRTVFLSKKMNFEVKISKFNLNLPLTSVTSTSDCFQNYMKSKHKLLVLKCRIILLWRSLLNLIVFDDGGVDSPEC